MDSAQIIVTAGGALVILLVLWFFFGKREQGRGRAAAAYRCPMHPWITSNDPAANCSVCGMKLTETDQS